ncbi:uncharacterized protein LOC117102462 isoform X2 [Anneissia japonica]|uniref:uncharacterized protein LOC117102462 isoform X2 n=1 Tax=Anneissia japonica TaxID=1529436 RepID=UPI001425AD73|nr:uncharacterized protein LOC117102462 isoform X2 [Anneissia japonica]
MLNEPDNFGSLLLQIAEVVDIMKNVSKPVQQLFVHVPGETVLCADISVHEPVECLKMFLRYELQNRANFYTTRNKKLKTDLSFYEQGLENECNIFIRFSEGLVGGSGNFPQEPSSKFCRLLLLLLLHYY